MSSSSDGLSYTTLGEEVEDEDSGSDSLPESASVVQVLSPV